MGIFSSGSNESISSANAMDKAETVDDLYSRARDQLAAGNQATAGQLIRQAIALEDGL